MNTRGTRNANIFYRNRGQRVVRLNRIGNTSKRGRFHCEVPDSNNIIQTFYVIIGMFFKCLLH